jgi:hypothetical protein
MDDVKQKAAAILVCCRGYSRNMAENCLQTLAADEIAALATAAEPVIHPQTKQLLEYRPRPGCGEYVALVMDEIADRQALAEAEAACREKPLDQAAAAGGQQALENYAAAQQRRVAAEALWSPADDDDDAEPDDPTDIAEETPER